MYATVGWHYGKQAFGCMMTYAQFDRYPISKGQRLLLRASVLSVAVCGFVYQMNYGALYYPTGGGRIIFIDVPVNMIGFPSFFMPIARAVEAALALLVVGFVFFSNFKKHKAIPSLNLLVPWVSFFIWWLPIANLPVNYFYMIPFFHSLQYLPFAYRLEEPKISRGRWRNVDASLRLASLLIIGFLSFEFIPTLLDKKFDTLFNMDVLFFSVAFVVFINVHHFFIDSAVWKFNQREVREGLLGSA